MNQGRAPQDRSELTLLFAINLDSEQTSLRIRRHGQKIFDETIGRSLLNNLEQIGQIQILRLPCNGNPKWFHWTACDWLFNWKIVITYWIALIEFARFFFFSKRRSIHTFSILRFLQLWKIPISDSIAHTPQIHASSTRTHWNYSNSYVNEKQTVSTRQPISDSYFVPSVI